MLAKILKYLTKYLYPSGLAFKIPNDSVIEKLHVGLNVDEQEAYEGSIGILDSILADNDNFTADDAADWERRLGISTDSTDLDDRKLAIKRKYSSPGNIPARQHYLYLQGQLQAAGFDVYIHENRKPDGMGGFTYYEVGEAVGEAFGSLTFGSGSFGVTGDSINRIANYIDEVVDNQYVLPTDLSNTFFIGGETFGSNANVDIERKEEFRQLVLSLKPQQTVGLQLINYI